jgi:hypothetical protein
MNSGAMGIEDECVVRAIGLPACGDDGLVEGDSEHHMPSSWTRVWHEDRKASSCVQSRKPSAYILNANHSEVIHYFFWSLLLFAW